MRIPEWMEGGETEAGVDLDFPTLELATAERRSAIVRWAYRELCREDLDPARACVSREGGELQTLKRALKARRELKLE